jgi:hypothetical protein
MLLQSKSDAIPEALNTSHPREVFSGAMTGAIANLTCGPLVD